MGTPGPSNSLMLAVAGGVTGGLAVGIAGCYYYMRKSNEPEGTKERNIEAPGSLTSSSLTSIVGKLIVPPLPAVVVDMLRTAKLCYLATSSESAHLSLMRFTHTMSVGGSEIDVIIISTQRKTKKFEMIKNNPSVALLVHDFEPSSDVGDSDGGASDGQGQGQGQLSSPACTPTATAGPAAAKVPKGKYSITLNGIASVESGPVAEHYRALHLKHNPGYEQFINGDDIAIITVLVEGTRVCDLQDKVTHWSRKQRHLPTSTSCQVANARLE